MQRASADPLGAILHVAESNIQIAIGEMAPSSGPFMPHKWDRIVWHLGEKGIQGR